MDTRYFRFTCLCILVILCRVDGLFSQNWSMLNYCKERTSFNDQETLLHPPLEEKFNYRAKTSAASIGNLSFYDQILCASIQATPNSLEVLNVETKDTLWTFSLPESRGSMSFLVAQTSELCFAGGQYGKGLYALDKTSGEPVWFKEIGSLYTRNLILDEEQAFILGDSLYCIRIDDGSTVWSRDITFQGTPAVDDKYVFLVGGYMIHILDKTNGEIKWSRPHPDRGCAGITVDDQCFYTLSNDSVLAYNKETWDLKWHYVRPGDTLQVNCGNSLAITDDKLCFTIRNNVNGNGQLVTLDKTSGRFIWEHTFQGKFMFAPVIANGVVYIIPAAEKALYGFDIATGEQLFYDNTYRYRYQPIVANHRLYAAATNQIIGFGNLETSVEKATGSITRTKDLIVENYPNPFNAATTIRFTLFTDDQVTIKLHNHLGQEIRTLLKAYRTAGEYLVKVDGSELPSGLYFIDAQAGVSRSLTKCLLVK